VGDWIDCQGASNAENTGIFKVTAITYSSPNITITVSKPHDSTWTALETESGTADTIQRIGYYKDELYKHGGFAPTKYIHRRVAFENPANGMKIEFAAYVDNSTTIETYYKTKKVDDDVTTFDNRDWVLATINREVDPSIHAFNTVDHEYTIEGIDEYTEVQTKVVMYSTDSTRPPFIQDFRLIGLS
jgi:hypothetical protein